jgi:hypothetical protein
MNRNQNFFPRISTLKNWGNLFLFIKIKSNIRYYTQYLAKIKTLFSIHYKTNY